MNNQPQPKQKLSVGIFLLAVLFIVGMLLFKTQIGHTLGSRDIIIIAMLMSGLVTYWVCKFPLSGIKDTPVFGGGMEKLDCGSRYRLDVLDHHRCSHPGN